MNPIRILIVENNPEFREMLRLFMTGLGHATDTAGSLSEGIELCAARSYALAFVDLSLAEMQSAQAEEDFSNRDGLKLVERIKNSGEGTQVIVLSGQPDPQIVADSLQRFGAHHFQSKKELIHPKPGGEGATLLSLVNKHAALAQLNLLDGRDNVMLCLTQGVDTEIWIDRTLRTFRPTFGQDGLKRYFTDLVSRLGPVRQLKDEPWLCSPDMNRGRACGRFWSKALGRAVIAVFGASREIMEEAIAEQVPRPHPEVLLDLSEFNIHGRVYALPDAPRSLFREP